MLRNLIIAILRLTYITLFDRQDRAISFRKSKHSQTTLRGNESIWALS